MSTILRSLKFIKPLKNNLIYKRISTEKTESRYYIRIAFPDDFQKVLDFMSENYFKSEPTIVSVGLAGKPTPLIVSLMRQNIAEGLTLFAEDRSTGRVAGAAVNTKIINGDLENLEEIVNCCEAGPGRDLLNFYAHYTRIIDLSSITGVNVAFECSCLAVHPEHQRQNLARRLVAESWFLARELGFKLFKIDCSSRFTARIAEKFDWTCIRTISYRDYREDGRLVFNNVQPPHTEMKIYIDNVIHLDGYHSERS